MLFVTPQKDDDGDDNNTVTMRKIIMICLVSAGFVAVGVAMWYSKSVGSTSETVET